MNLLWRVALRIAYRVALVYWFVFRPERKGVYVAVWYGRQVLLIENSYRAKQTFPSGGVERGESDQEAALRELRPFAWLNAPPAETAGLIHEQLAGEGPFQHLEHADSLTAYNQFLRTARETALHTVCRSCGVQVSRPLGCHSKPE